MGFQDNFVSFANWIKERLEIQLRVEESVELMKASERAHKRFIFEDVEGTASFQEDSESDQDSSKDITAAGQEYPPRQKHKRGIKSVATSRFKTTLESLANKSSPEPRTLRLEKVLCAFCRRNHSFSVCPKFDRIPHQEKNIFVRKNKICYHCLNPGHVASRCDYYPGRTCKVDNCTGSHHKKLHPPKAITGYSYEKWYDDEVIGSALGDQNNKDV